MNNYSRDVSKSYSNRMFGIVMLLFLLFAACFLFYQSGREKDYRIKLLDKTLQAFNSRLHSGLLWKPDSVSLSTFCELASAELSCRVTIIDSNGIVLFDNDSTNAKPFGNHLHRREIAEARRHGHGYDICRKSASVGGEFFYSAAWYPDEQMYIRSALPYNAPQLTELLEQDLHYVYFAAAVFVALTVVLYLFNKRLGVYRQMRRMQDDIAVERDKLLTHLRISREGLGVFTPERRALLVNPLFTKYVDIISDSNLNDIASMFDMTEFAQARHFLNETATGGMGGERIGVGGERRIAYNVSKAGRVFAISCVIFADKSFEVAINDVTEREWQSTLKHQLTQNVAHELRTPVSGIQGYLETIVQNPSLSDDKMRHFIERSYALSTRLTNMLRDISLLTKMDEASAQSEMADISLEDVIHEAVADMTDDIADRNMHVSITMPDHLPIRGNASLLYSVFRNLVENSVSYAGEGTTISINLFRHDMEYYYFSYSDNGVGVPEEHLPRLFERFYRVDKGRSRKMGGTGLGLAIVKNAVLLHGGSISAKQHPGKGLEFIFTLRAPYTHGV